MSVLFSLKLYSSKLLAQNFDQILVPIFDSRSSHFVYCVYKHLEPALVRSKSGTVSRKHLLRIELPAQLNRSANRTQALRKAVLLVFSIKKFIPNCQRTRSSKLIRTPGEQSLRTKSMGHGSNGISGSTSFYGGSVVLAPRNVGCKKKRNNFSSTPSVTLCARSECCRTERKPSTAVGHRQSCPANDSLAWARRLAARTSA